MIQLVLMEQQAELKPNIKYSHLYIFLGACLLVVSGLVGAFTTYVFYPRVIEVISTATGTVPIVQRELEETHFITDRFVFFDDSGESPFILEVNASRREEEGAYTHYYSLEVLQDGEVFDDYVIQKMNTAPISPIDFLTSYTSLTPEDQSPRESFSFTVAINDEESAQITIPSLTADIIIKNTPEYTKYYSLGIATITIGNKVRTAQVLHGRTYSEDYTKSIFFEEPEGFFVDSTQFIGWDINGTFYLFDQSETSQYLPAYVSHQWGIKKNASGAVERFFSFDLQQDDTHLFTVGLGSERIILTRDNETDLLHFYDDKYTGYAGGQVVREDGVSIQLSGLLYTADNQSGN